MSSFIYALIDPIDQQHIRYVGMSLSNSLRPYEHAKIARKSTRQSYLLHWIRSLHANGREPKVLILEELSYCSSRAFLGFIESCYIKSLRSIGHHLTNATNGGDGGDTFSGRKHTDQTREKMRLSGRNHIKTKDHCISISKARNRQYEDPLEREKMREAALRAYSSQPELKEKLRIATLKQWQTPGFREKVKAQIWTPEAREKIAESNRRRRGIKKGRNKTRSES